MQKRYSVRFVLRPTGTRSLLVCQSDKSIIQEPQLQYDKSKSKDKLLRSKDDKDKANDKRRKGCVGGRREDSSR